MLDQQKQLAARYAALRDTRSGPVFFIEHGLAETEIADLIADVRAATGVHPLDSWWWDVHKLPLIAASTEVGYRYRGTGTNFWPVLEEELGAHVGGASRQRVRDLFASAAKTFRGAHPPATPWAKAFHLIAWPITHALIPLEFHRPLALTLANLRESVAELDDDALCRAIRIAATGSAARFSTLLETPDLIVSVARNLLGATSTELCPEAMQRIADDLAADHVARRSVAVARRIQRAVRATVPSRTPPRRDATAIKGLLQLRRHDEAFTLEASFPSAEPQLSTRLRRVLRQRRYAPQLWGLTTRVPSEQLLSGLPFALKLTSLPADDAPLLPGLNELSIESDLLETLEAFELRLETLLIFAIRADGEIAGVIKGTGISGHHSYWVLTSEPRAPLAPFPVLAEIGPYTCHALDPQIPAAAQAIEDLGYRVLFGISVSFAGAPPLRYGATTPSFVVGDHFLIVPRRAHPDGVFVELDGVSARISDEFVRVTVPPDERVMRISSAGESGEFPFKGVSEQPEPPLAACNIDLRSSDLTVQALLSGSLSFMVDALAPLDGLALTVEIEAADRRCSASIPLGPLPQTLSSDDEPWSTILNDATREHLLQVPRAAFHIRVGCLAARSWELEQRVRPCWWMRQPDGVMLKSELGSLEYGQVAAASPHLKPTPNVSAPESEARLFVPVGLDPAEYGSAAQFTTLCLAPGRASLEAPAVPKPCLERRRRAENGAAGLEDLLEAYLRWSLAESENLIAELRRRQTVNEIDAWVVELCCGEVWGRREAAASRLNAWEMLVRRCEETGLGLDSYVELAGNDKHDIIRRAVSNIHSALPELWSRVGPPCDLGDADYDLLDSACIKAYEDLSNHYRDRGRLDLAKTIGDGDPSADTDPERWREELGRVQAEVEFHELAELLLPTDIAWRLIALDASVMSLDDLSEELMRWTRDARTRKALSGGAPSAEALRASVALWTEPETAINLDWPGALDLLIKERSVARAARYLALKTRQARRGGST